VTAEAPAYGAVANARMMPASGLCGQGQKTGPQSLIAAEAFVIRSPASQASTDPVAANSVWQIEALVPPLLHETSFAEESRKLELCWMNANRSGRRRWASLGITRQRISTAASDPILVIQFGLPAARNPPFKGTRVSARTGPSSDGPVWPRKREIRRSVTTPKPLLKRIAKTASNLPCAPSRAPIATLYWKKADPMTLTVLTVRV
jgi:hypothetical protein